MYAARRLHTLIFTALLLACPAFGQLVNITHTGITDESGIALANGLECFTPVANNGTPIPANWSGGTITKVTKCYTVTSGSLQAGVQLFNSDTTGPQHLCYLMTLKDQDTSGTLIGPSDGYGCLQFHGDTDIHTIPPRLPALSLVTPGPAGISFTWRGPWSANGIYAVNDVTSFDGSSWVCIAANGTGAGNAVHPDPAVDINAAIYWQLQASIGTAGTAGVNGAASLITLAQLRNATYPVPSNFYDRSLNTSATFVDANSGNLIAQSGFTSTGFIAANSGGYMTFSLDIPAFSVSNSDPYQSTTSNLISSDDSLWLKNSLINNSGGVETHGGYQETPYFVVSPGQTYTTNIFVQGGNWDVTYWAADKSFIQTDTTVPGCPTSGGQCITTTTFTAPTTATIRYGRIGVGTMAGSDPNGAVGGTTPFCPTQASIIAGTTFPAAGTCPPAFSSAATATQQNGLAEYDQNQHRVRGVSGPIAALTPLSIGSDIAFVRAAFAGDPSSALMVCNAATCPSSHTAFVGTPPGSNSGSSAPTLPQIWPAMVNADWWLPMTETSGTTLHDATAHGHDTAITGSGAAAVLTGYGVQLNAQTAVIPTASGRNSFGYCADFPAGGGPDNYEYLYSTAAGGQGGYNLGTSYGPSSTIFHGALAYYPQIGNSNGGPYSIGADGFSGTHCVAALATTGEIAVDGHPLSGYIYQGSSSAVGGAQLTNAMTLLGGSGNSSGIPVTIYSAWASQDTNVSAVAAKTASEVARLKQAGVSFGYTLTSQLTDDVCVVDGTSIDQGFQASARPITRVAFTKPCTVYDYSVSGQGSMDIAAGVESRGVPHPFAGRNIAYTGGVTNGMMNFSETPQMALNDTLTWIRKRHAEGFKVIVSTMQSRCGNNGAGTASGDAQAQIYNADLLSVGDEADWVDNVAAWPALGATNACANTANFADGTHDTDTGQAMYVANEQAAFNGVYRNPNPITFTSSYSQQPPDSILAGNCSSACAVTLMNANTVSFNRNGRLTIHNLGSASVTLTPASGQTINGAATLSLATGATATLMPYVAVAAVGGANWITVQP